MDRFTAMQAFRNVAEQGTFTAAGERLGLSKSVVSKQISALEQHLGVRLLNRTTRRVQLTEAGEHYYERCRRILGDVEDLELAMGAETTRPRGTLRVTVPVSFGRLHLAPLMPPFLARYPELEVDLTLDDRQIDLVDSGVDAAVRISRLGDSSLIARRIASCQSWVCAAPDYLAHAGTPTHPEDLTGHNCLRYAYAPRSGEWQLRDGQGHVHRIPVHGNLRANNGETLLEAARQATGIVMLPDFIAGEAVAGGSLQRLLPGFEGDGLGVYVVYPYTRHVSARLRVFIDYLVAAFASDG